MKSQATKILQSEYKNIFKTPVEGFKISLVDDSDMFQWKIALFGPPDTLYAGGYFKALMKFPDDYPYSPPTFRFITKMFHSNIYQNGEVCISILHQPGTDEQSGESPNERWNPTQNVRTILLSVVSLLNEPNTSSPANVDASVMYRKWKESDGKETEYANIIKNQVEESKKEAALDGVEVPTTVEDYCISDKSRASDETANHQAEFNEEDFYSISDDSDDDDDDDDDNYHENDVDIHTDNDEDCS